MSRLMFRQRPWWVGPLAALLLTVGATASLPAHAGRITSYIPPVHALCWLDPAAARITLYTGGWVVEVSGSCFLGTTDYVAVYDLTQGRYLTRGGPWQAVTVDGNGNFSWIVVPGAGCGDLVEAIGYDTGWNRYTNQGNWQAGTLQCPPR